MAIVRIGPCGAGYAAPQTRPASAAPAASAARTPVRSARAFDAPVCGVPEPLNLSAAAPAPVLEPAAIDVQRFLSMTASLLEQMQSVQAPETHSAITGSLDVRA